MQSLKSERAKKEYEQFVKRGDAKAESLLQYGKSLYRRRSDLCRGADSAPYRQNAVLAQQR